MQIKIKEDVYGALKPYAGQWLDVDTQYLFNNQYNAVGINIRVMDSDVSAVRDDERAGKVKCGYCRKMFNNPAELEAHYREEENAARNCNGCWWYRDQQTNVERTEAEERTEDGKLIKTYTTVYTCEKQCTFKDGCTKLEHRNHKPEYFTKENTYFLKYPNGYGAYFAQLDRGKQCEEKKMEWIADARTMIDKRGVGSYNVYFRYNELIELQKIEFINNRNCFTLHINDLQRVFSNNYHVGYMLSRNDDNSLRYNPLENFPKSQKENAYKYLDNLRHWCKSEHIKNWLLGW